MSLLTSAVGGGPTSTSTSGAPSGSGCERATHGLPAADPAPASAVVGGVPREEAVPRAGAVVDVDADSTVLSSSPRFTISTTAASTAKMAPPMMAWRCRAARFLAASSASIFACRAALCRSRFASAMAARG